MNTAVRAAVRMAIDKGHKVLGIHRGFEGLIEDDIHEYDWMTVNGWAHRGGAELGTNRKVPSESDFYAIARNFEKHNIDGLLVVGGWSGYEAVLEIFRRRETFPAFALPIVCLPATIDRGCSGPVLCTACCAVTAWTSATAVSWSQVAASTSGSPPR